MAGFEPGRTRSFRVLRLCLSASLCAHCAAKLKLCRHRGRWSKAVRNECRSHHRHLQHMPYAIAISQAHTSYRRRPSVTSHLMIPHLRDCHRYTRYTTEFVLDASRLPTVTETLLVPFSQLMCGVPVYAGWLQICISGRNGKRRRRLS